MGEEFGKWIPIKEKFPEKHRKVLVQHEDGMLDIDMIYPDNTFSLERRHGKVVAWMPLPELYKGK